MNLKPKDKPEIKSLPLSEEDWEVLFNLDFKKEADKKASDRFVKCLKEGDGQTKYGYEDDHPDRDPSKDHNYIVAMLRTRFRRIGSFIIRTYKEDGVTLMRGQKGYNPNNIIKIFKTKAAE